jgi:hypothetical protein
MTEVKAYKFSSCATDIAPNILNGKTPIEFLTDKYSKGCIFGLDCLKKSACYKFMGWSFNFSPFLKKFLVKQYDHWQEMYAPNQTAIRLSTYGRIEMIVELK